MTVEFESWANDITEQTWDNDTDDRDEQNLNDLMQAPIAVGVDAADAIAAISSIEFLKNEDLHQALIKLSKNQGPDADARRTIIGWLASNGENALANQFMQIMQQQNTIHNRLRHNPFLNHNQLVQPQWMNRLYRKICLFYAN